MMEMTVAKWLRAANFSDVLIGTVSALDCPEPVVVHNADYECDTKTRHDERGAFTVNVVVVRETAAAAGRVALDCETGIRRVAWTAEDATEGWRLCGVDTTVPAFQGYDGSGRAVFGFKVTLNCERDDDA